MTIIAASHREMAADQLVIGAGAPPIYSHKIGWIGGSIFGAAGDSDASIRFLDWRRRIHEAKSPKTRREEERDAPVYEADADFECLELCEEGLFLWSQRHARLLILNQYYAIGTGDSLAIHHMMTGKSPKRACELVMRANKWAVGDIDVLALP